MRSGPISRRRRSTGIDGDTTGDDFEKAEVEVTPGGE